MAGKTRLSIPQKVVKWRSGVRWEHKHGFKDDLTTDDHPTREQALAVCGKLLTEGLGGERIHFPLETWVEKVISFPTR